MFPMIHYFQNIKIREDILKEHEPKLYNAALRNTAKLFLNSLSGKVIQRNYEEEV